MSTWSRLGTGLLRFGGFLVIIGTVVAMAVWPTDVTILLFAVALAYPAWEKHVESRINRALDARRERAATRSTERTE